MNAGAKTLARLKYAGGFLLGAGLLYLAFREVQFDELAETLKETRYEWVAAGLGVSLFSHWLRGYRWRLLLGASGHDVSAANCFAAVMVGYMVNYGVPRLGEVVRCTALTRSNDVPLSASFGTVVTERAFDLFSLALLFGFALLFEFDRIAALFQSEGGAFPVAKLLVALGVLAAGALAAYLLRGRIAESKFAQKLRQFVRELLRSAWSVRKLRSPSLFLAVSALIWAAYVTVTWCFLMALPEAVAAGYGFYFAAIITAMGAVGMAIPTPGGVGSYHYTVILSFRMYGRSEALGATLALLIHTPQVVMNSLAGAIGYFYLIAQKPKTKAYANS